MLLAIDDAARTEGRSTLVLDTFADWGARRLYESCGWIHSGDIPKFSRMSGATLGATSIYHKLL